MHSKKRYVIYYYIIIFFLLRMLYEYLVIKSYYIKLVIIPGSSILMFLELLTILILSLPFRHSINTDSDSFNLNLRVEL